jgi:DUF4097 and DUF4098 domain-containing protein YvlB
MQKRLQCLVFGILILTGAVSAWDTREQEDFQQTFQLAANGVFSLSNVNGGVIVQAWDHPTTEIRAVKRGPSKENMDLVKIDIRADANHINVETIYPKGRNNLNVSVSYEVRLPKTVILRSVETVNGSVEVQGMTAEVTAETVNGSVKVLNSSGRVSATTVNGGITAELNRIDAEGDMKFETVNGSIKLILPEGAGADVAAETVNGSVSSDFPVTVRGKFGPKRLQGVLGQGGANIRMETVNGGISLARR